MMEASCSLCGADYENYAHPRTGAIMARVCKCEYVTSDGVSTLVIPQSNDDEGELAPGETTYSSNRFPQVNIDLKQAYKLAVEMHAPLRKCDPNDPATMRRVIVTLGRALAEMRHLWC